MLLTAPKQTLHHCWRCRNTLWRHWQRRDKDSDIGDSAEINSATLLTATIQTLRHTWTALHKNYDCWQYWNKPCDIIDSGKTNSFALLTALKQILHYCWWKWNKLCNVAGSDKTNSAALLTMSNSVAYRQCHHKLCCSVDSAKAISAVFLTSPQQNAIYCWQCLRELGNLVDNAKTNSAALSMVLKQNPQQCWQSTKLCRIVNSAGANKLDNTKKQLKLSLLFWICLEDALCIFKSALCTFKILQHQSFVPIG